MEARKNNTAKQPSIAWVGVLVCLRVTHTKKANQSVGSARETGGSYRPKPSVSRASARAFPGP